MSVFGDRFGMSRTNIGRYESGEYEASVSFCMTLAKLTGISIERLVLEKLKDDEIPPLPLGEGGEKFVKAVSSENLGDLMDIRNVAAAVHNLQLDMERMKGLFENLDADGMEKLKMFEAVQLIIGQLEAGLDESEYLTEKKAYLGRLAALLGSKATS
ncbi:MAG: helix-turn-helix transcriptional regulator [Saprospiraceae bacterium]|nr:helix-turn-helix transcriptional regulator [Saprospiraceae bacterium]MCF8250938.1 helix-turn-helix transcriptional regulator [Saprospiraceae bacterium]MCF8281916.1 helix-turn-helix transcriptional regulator [Bacteroidales bacterium]MCF8311903.1 helix-turn-helix transcriptional regulator [Saprospiraceae bacterium]MCF8441911.1 helix-turn-helix transcriptional regulator [Saprospiraceae bacterium]